MNNKLSIRLKTKILHLNLSNRIFYLIKIILLFIPLLIYLGKRSPIAFDEGYYILQSKSILNSGDWFSPVYFQGLVLDRTIGIQSLIAFSQKIFGENSFAIYIPNIIGGSLMLFLTALIHKELVDKKNALVSSLILSTTFLWINYYHLATQDIIYGSLVTLGIYSSIKAKKNNNNLFFLFSGLWIGLSFMMKTFLVAIPLLAILPFFKSSKILFKKYFWLGLILGFIPFLIWSLNIISLYGFEIYNGLFEKLLTLSEKNTFSNPFYYYAWNLISNGLPWSLFSLIGFLSLYKSSNKLSNYFLFRYPIILMILLSIFSTKTPYYPIQLLPVISINSFLGIDYIFRKNNIFSKQAKKLFFLIFPLCLILIIAFLKYKNYFNAINESTQILITIVMLIFSFALILINKIKTYNKKIILILIGPYLLFCVLVQSGIFCDRSKEMRIAAEEIIAREFLNDKKVEFITKNASGENATTKLIKIAIFMPKIGEGIEKIDELKENQYAWINESREKLLKKDSFSLISESKIFEPWKLILKK